MNIEKERELFLAHMRSIGSAGFMFELDEDGNFDDMSMAYAWSAWQAAKSQAVSEQDQQVWATSNLTWKDIAFRVLSCKVLKSTENWVHVKNIAGVGSTTASLICKKLGVDPNGTKFDLIEAQEQNQ